MQEKTGNLQHGSGRTLRERSSNPADPSHYGQERQSVRQRLRGKAMEDGEVRRSISQGIRECTGVEEIAYVILHLLQRGKTTPEAGL